MLADDLVGWVPYGLRRDAGQLVIDWHDLGERALREPFFDQAIHASLREHRHSTRSTGVEVLDELPRVAPTGFIFHMSRCGSTLVSQMLAAVPRFLVVSEPAVLDSALRGTVARPELFAGIASALVRPRGDRDASFIKLTARAALDHVVISRAFPEVRSIFIYRDPLEAVVALVGSSRDRLPPGLATSGLVDGATNEMRPAEFWARCVGRQCEAALAMSRDLRTRLVSYDELPDLVHGGIARFFGLSLSTAEIEDMRAASTRSAKVPSATYRSDREAKRIAATDEVRAAVEQHARSIYDELETLRLSTTEPISAA